MSERMLDLLRDLPAALGDLGHGDPDEPGRVLAADVVRWAAEEIARLREERRWIPVGERLPRFGRDVLAATEPFEDGSRLMEVGSVVKCKWSLNGIHGDFPPVTHWMPLPPGPEPKEANRE